jgi:hypothetical protein
MSIGDSPYDLAKAIIPVETEYLEATEHLGAIRTNSRVPGNPNYYEKEGLRTTGDGVDHSHYNTVSSPPTPKSPLSLFVLSPIFPSLPL